MNAAKDRAAAAPHLPPYHEFLRHINDEIDLEARRIGSAFHARQQAIESRPRMCPEGGGVLDRRLSPDAEALKSGNLPVLPQVVRQLVIQETYQVRNLLSRGAVIDLIG